MQIPVHSKNPYIISIHNNIKAQYGEILKPYIKSDVILIFDIHISQDIKTKIELSFIDCGLQYKIITLQKFGEDIKTLQFFEEFCKELLTRYSITRKTTLVAIGGGTVGDFVGFVASSLMRGIPFIQIPTTLLAMVDSSVGGKVAVNIGQYKNIVGSFYQPKHVLIDIDFLKTLPSIELISGYAEVLKYGLIRSPDFYQYLLKNTDIFTNFIQKKQIEQEACKYLMAIIRQSCTIKSEIVNEDEFEVKQIREILNFGHTFGHAFEGLYLGKIPHGIAVGIGMICALKYSGINTEEIEKHYKQIGLFATIAEFCKTNNITKPTVIETLKLMTKDKKNTKNQNFVEIEGVRTIDTIKLVLLKQIGIATIDDISTKAIYSFLCDL